MHMRSGEEVKRVVHRHITPYIFSLIGILLLAMPFFLIAFMLRSSVGNEIFLWIIAILSFFVGIVIVRRSIDFLLDKVIVTNRRVIHSNWRSIFHREEDEIELNEIQDIKIVEKGILAALASFNYGTMEIETAASTPSVIFKDSPNPEELKHFILGQQHNGK